jgi:serine/threonine protein kinase
LADFGAAVQLTKQNDQRATLMGTDHWVAPEMIFAKKNPGSDTKYNTLVDIWSFGIFAVECATTQPPFFQERKPDTLYNLILKAPEVDLGPKGSKELQKFIRRIL